MGGRYTWDELVERYPSMWVCLKDCEMDRPDVISGVLVEVVNDDGIDDCMARNMRNGCRFGRTTEDEVFGGLITIEGVEIRLEEYDTPNNGGIKIC